MTIIHNANSAFGLTTLDQTALPLTIPVKTSTVVKKGDVVVWDGQTTNDAPTVHIADVSADDPALVAGVAYTAATVAGDVILVVRSGPTLVNIGNGTVAAGERATFHGSTDGAADGVAADATTVAGDTFGVYLGAEVGTTDQAVLDVRCA